MKCYFDNAATTPLTNEMKAYLISVLDVFGNPSSLHSEGVLSRNLIETTRKTVAKFINAKDSNEIYFTSSGSASNTLAISGYVSKNKCEIYYSPTSHKSILKNIDGLNILKCPLKVNGCGEIDIADLEQKLKKCQKKPFVIFEYANSEIGTIQDVKIISDLVHQYNGVVMVDCTGSISSIPLDVQSLEIDLAIFSGHKIGALKGVGILYKKNIIELSPLVFGAQEEGLFGGTENILGIASVGKAIELLHYDTSYARDFVWYNIKNIDGLYLVGKQIYEKRLNNNLYICVKGVQGQRLVAMMDDLFNTQISTGSACNNGEPTPSVVLKAIGILEEDIHNCIRISFKGNETDEQLEQFCKNLSLCISMLKD